VPNTVTNQAGCDAHITGCVYAGTGICVVKGACSGYTAYGALAADKSTNCSGMIDTASKSCFYNTTTAGANCESKSCSNVPGTISG